MTYAELVKYHGASNHWRLGETSGTTAVDIIGGANGTISGGVTLGQSGVIADGNKAMTFDGTSGRVTVPLGSHSAFGTNPFTVELWAMSTRLPTGGEAVHSFIDTKGNGTTGGGVQLNMTNTHVVRLSVEENALAINSVSSAVGLLTLNQWHQVLGVITRSPALRLDLWIDGVLAGSKTTAIAGTDFTSTAATVFGAASQGTVWFHAGVIDEVAIYPRALTAPEIAAHYTTGLSNDYAVSMVLLTTGQTISLNAGEIYALPPVPVTIQSGAQVQTSILYTGPFTNVPNGLVNGAFLKSASNTTIRLQKYIIEA